MGGWVEVGSRVGVVVGLGASVGMDRVICFSRLDVGAVVPEGVAEQATSRMVIRMRINALFIDELLYVQIPSPILTFKMGEAGGGDVFRSSTQHSHF